MSNGLSFNPNSFDPGTMATNLATAATQDAQQLLYAQSQAAQATSQGLTTLQNALSAFSTALSGLSSLPGQSVTKYSATLGNTALGTATANNSAVPGTYTLSVQQVATQNAISFNNVSTTAVPKPPAPGSTIAITLQNGSAATISLSSSTGSMSPADIARAINQQSNGVVTATIVTGTNGSGQPTTQLTLTSGVSGAQGAIASIAYNANGGSGSNPLNMAQSTTTVAAQDAIATVNGVTVQQGSNTLTAIPGVTLNLTQAQATGAAATTLIVARDNNGTDAQVQNFVNAYNTVHQALDGLTAIGRDGSASGAFANDAGLKSLEGALSSTLRRSFGGQSLMQLGVSADTSGNLSLNTTTLNNVLNTNPTALDNVLGNASLSSPSGLLGSLSTVVKSWTDPATGQIHQRQQSEATLSKSLASKQTALTKQYNDDYDRYMAKFTALQGLQAQMAQTLSMFS